MENQMQTYLKALLENMPADWLKLTTHRLDIYNEEQAKFEFLSELEKLYEAGDASANTLAALPTAYDYIRLGHPLSCVLEWVIAKNNHTTAANVISFSSRITPIMAVLRKNLLTGKKTKIIYHESLPDLFNAALIQKVYGYHFELTQIDDLSKIAPFEGSTIYVNELQDLTSFEVPLDVDFYLGTLGSLGSIILINGERNADYIGEIQHVRRRETIAMTPFNTHKALLALLGQKVATDSDPNRKDNQAKVVKTIQEITQANTKALVGSSGLSIQYAIAMGLIDHAMEQHPGKAIKFIVPPNCYGGTNDQARRVAACIDQVEVMDLPVDGGNDMVQSIDQVLEEIASMDAVPFIIAEIPTNPRVEVPNLDKLRAVLSQERKTVSGEKAIDPVFILDQTFCPNVHFLGESEMLSSVRTIAYVSGSKFPSGGLCTAGYCIANKKAENLMSKIEVHLQLCENEATDLQLELLAKQMPSMLQRIEDAYLNTRKFVNFIGTKLPDAKINFVSEELADLGFRPSVFSLDLPTKGNSDEARENYKRELNNKLINMMIDQIPNESKYCVSYGQLKGCYWTIPATSTQGTTKEGDKDYIVRVALSANMDLEHHQRVFTDFVSQL